MQDFDYLDLDLLIERSGSDYQVRVLSSPAGQTPPLPFHVPFSDLQIENFLLRIGRPRQIVRRINTPEIAAIKEFGGQLFEAVFRSDLASNLSSSLNLANVEDKGLRIRLRLSGVPELADLPWEYLYDRRNNRFLCLSDRTPLVRYLEVPEPVRAFTVKPPLRVLVVIASPVGYPALDGEQEWRKVSEALSGLVQAGRVQMERLAKPTLDTLQRQLRQGRYHVFHFVGHGGFDAHAQDGVLAFEDAHGQARLVSGEDLGTMLHDHRSLRLAVLNACEGARGGRADPFGGTSQSLVQQGIPAVIAMQFEITDTAATVFAQVLYEAVADGYPLDAATAEARKAIYAAGNQLEWGTPVLYLRAAHGHIFDMLAVPGNVSPSGYRDSEEGTRWEVGVQARPAEGQAGTEAFTGSITATEASGPTAIPSVPAPGRPDSGETDAARAGSGTTHERNVVKQPARLGTLPAKRSRRIALAITAVIVLGALTGFLLWFLAPQLRSPGGSSSTASPAGSSTTTAECGAIKDEFDTTRLASGWQQLNGGRFVLGTGGMAITASDGADIRSDLQGAVTAPFLARTVRGDFSIETTVTVNPRYSYQAAGLLLYRDRENYVRLERGFGRRGAIAFEYSADGRHTKIHGPFSGPDPVPTSATVVRLRLVRTGTSVKGFWHPANTTTWRELSGTAPLAGDAKVGVAVLNRSQPPAGDPGRKPLTATFSYVDVVC